MRRKTEKISNIESKSNIELKLSNFRYNRNCYQDFVKKLQINTANTTYNHTSSDKVPFSYILMII